MLLSLVLVQLASLRAAEQVPPAGDSNSLAHAVAIFRGLDADGDRFLGPAENAAIEGVADDERSSADHDKDGRIDRGEFLALHLRTLERSGRRPAADLQAEVARVLARRRVRQLAQPELRALASSRVGAGTSARRAHALSELDPELSASFRRLEADLLARTDPAPALALFRSALQRARSRTCGALPASEADRDRKLDALLISIEVDARGSSRLAVVHLKELRDLLGVAAPSHPSTRPVAGPSGNTVVPGSTLDTSASRTVAPALHLSRMQFAIVDLELALAAQRATEPDVERLRRWILVQGGPADAARSLALQQCLGEIAEARRTGKNAPDAFARLRALLAER